MRLKYGIVADEIVQTSGKHSAIGIFNLVLATQFPTQQNVAMLMGIEAKASEVGSHDFEIALLDSDHKPLMSIVGQINVGKPIEGIPTIAEIGGSGQINFERPGVYEFVLRVGGRHIDAITFYVTQMVPAED